MATLSTDFSDSPTFSERWAPNGTVSIETSGIPGGGLGGTHALKHVNGAGQFCGASWDDAGTPSDEVDVLAHVYSVDSNESLQIFIHGSGAQFGENCYYTDGDLASSGDVRLREYTSGSFGQLGSAADSLTNAVWTWVRIRSTSTHKMCKMWTGAYGDEPASWHVNAADTTKTTGWIGSLVRSNGLTQWLDWLSVGTAGDPAPGPSAAFTGTLAATMQEPTMSATGHMVPAGSVAATMQRALMNATGHMVPSGAIVSELQAATASLTGVMQPEGTVAATLQQLTASLTGVMQPEGEIAATLQAATFAGTGTHAEVTTGTLAATLTLLSYAGQGYMLPEGSIAASIQRLAFSGAGEIPITGVIAAVLQELVFAATGTWEPFVELGNIYAGFLEATEGRLLTERRDTLLQASEGRLLTGRSDTLLQSNEGRLL